ncbi:MAG: substrate-binding domain-containing protein [Pirellulales bacterium]|nr:substrate-binding domain-containing protein [Pirellulales bacterium]
MGKRCLILRLLSVVLLAVTGCAEDSSTAKSDQGAAPGAAGDFAKTSSEGGERRSIVMIPKATQASFWNAVRRGAERAAEEANVELTWKGPALDNDRAGQKRLIQQFLSEGFDGILLAPTDNAVLVPEVRAAKDKGIPVLIFDSALDGEPGEDFVGFIATDNLAAGKLGGKHLMELVGNGGKTILFRHMEGQQSTSLREQGALDEMRAEDAEVLVENRYTGKDASEAQKTALNMIDTIREADGIFASNQTASEGLLIALQKNNLIGKLKVVGFDSSPLLVEALAKSEIDALVVQDPVNMGYMSVKAMVDHLDGKKIEPVVSTACKLVTRENMNEAEIKPLIE